MVDDEPTPVTEVPAETDATPAPTPAPAAPAPPTDATDATDAPKTLSPEEKRALDTKFGKTIQAFLDKAREEGADFPKLAKQYVDASGDDSIKTEYHKFDAMSQSEPDEAFKDEATVLRAIFSQQKNAPIFHTREDKGIWVIHLTDIQEPRDLTLEEATEQIKEALTGAEALEVVTAKSEESREKLADATKDGSTFKAAAEKLGYEVTRLAYDRTPPADSGIDQRMLGQAVYQTVPGQISETQVNAPDGAALVYVAQKSVGEEDAAAGRSKDNIAHNLRGGSTYSPGYGHWLFRSWLQKLRKEADPQPPLLDFRQLPGS